jgi:hypothetical protein
MRNVAEQFLVTQSSHQSECEAVTALSGGVSSTGAKSTAAAAARVCTKFVICARGGGLDDTAAEVSAEAWVKMLGANDEASDERVLGAR